MVRQTIFLLSVLTLSACGTVRTAQQGNNVELTFTDPPFIAFPREAAFSHPDVQTAMMAKAVQACPNGYRKIKEKYSKEHDHLVWEIKCY